MSYIAKWKLAKEEQPNSTRNVLIQVDEHDGNDALAIGWYGAIGNWHSLMFDDREEQGWDVTIAGEWSFVYRWTELPGVN